MFFCTRLSLWPHFSSLGRKLFPMKNMEKRKKERAEQKKNERAELKKFHHK
jgi:hypothetical protein